jgi:signal transduction histidine kinase
LPDISGNILVKWIRKSSKAIPIIAMTGHSDPNLILSAMKNGCNDLLKKPFKPRDSNYLVQRIIQLTRLKEEDLHADWEKVYIEFLESNYADLESNYTNLQTRFRELEESSKEDLTRTFEHSQSVCGSVAHGLKNEFLHIGYASKEIRELTGHSEEISEECDIIERSIAYSQVLMQRLTSYLEIGLPSKEKVHISQLLQQVDLMVRPRLRTSIKLDISAKPGILKLELPVNSEVLMGILLELIENASTALIPKGGTIEIAIMELEKDISITVKDNGPGIPKKIRKKLLKEPIPSKKGHGLGLYFCGRIVSGYGGELVFSASKKSGTTFTLTIPKTDDKKE